jgi:hypothetical protein
LGDQANFLGHPEQNDKKRLIPQDIQIFYPGEQANFCSKHANFLDQPEQKSSWSPKLLKIFLSWGTKRIFCFEVCN